MRSCGFKRLRSRSSSKCPENSMRLRSLLEPHARLKAKAFRSESQKQTAHATKCCCYHTCFRYHCRQTIQTRLLSLRSVPHRDHQFTVGSLSLRGSHIGAAIPEVPTIKRERANTFTLVKCSVTPDICKRSPLHL